MKILEAFLHTTRPRTFNTMPRKVRCIGREHVVQMESGDRYRGIITRCEDADTPGDYLVWLQCGQYINGPFKTKRLS